MGLQETPICFNCSERVNASDAVFAAPCDHDECPSVVMHGICLMDWRENRENASKRIRMVVIDMESILDVLEEEDE